MEAQGSIKQSVSNLCHKLFELSPGYEISALIGLLSTKSSMCIEYFEKELDETLHV